MNPKQTNVAFENDQQSRTALVEHLSDCVHQHQTMKTMTTKKEPTLILTCYRGTNLKTQTSIRQKVCHHPFRKPTLCSRISLAMSNECDLLYSTATDQFCSSPKQSGLTCPVVMPSTSTTSFQTSTWCPTTPGMLSSSGRMSGYSMALSHQQRQLKPMVIGSSPGTPSLMPLFCLQA